MEASTEGEQPKASIVQSRRSETQSTSQLSKLRGLLNTLKSKRAENKLNTDHKAEPVEFPQDSEYFKQKYREYYNRDLVFTKTGERYPSDPKTGRPIDPRKGNFDELPPELKKKLGYKAKNISDKRKDQNLPEVLVHATTSGPNIVNDGFLWERSHFGTMDDLDPDAVVDPTIGNLHTMKSDFFVTTSDRIKEGDRPLSDFLLVTADPGRAEYLNKRFESLGKRTDIILLEDLMSYMESHDAKLPKLEQKRMKLSRAASASTPAASTATTGETSSGSGRETGV